MNRDSAGVEVGGRRVHERYGIDASESMPVRRATFG